MFLYWQNLSTENNYSMVKLYFLYSFEEGKHMKFVIVFFSLCYQQFSDMHFAFWGNTRQAAAIQDKSSTWTTDKSFISDSTEQHLQQLVSSSFHSGYHAKINLLYLRYEDQLLNRIQENLSSSIWAIAYEIGTDLLNMFQVMNYNHLHFL